MLTRLDFAQALRAFGVVEGDVLYVRGSLRALGRVRGDYNDIIIGGFLDALGPQGTLVAPAFTKLGHVFSSEKVVFDQNSVPYSGAFSKLLLAHPEHVRSKHPSHSFVAIGAKAHELLDGHTPETACFAPIQKLADLDGKMLLIGCNNESPGFSTVHLAQFQLGLSQRHLVRRLQRAWVREGETVRPFKPIELPGCSLSFGKFYPAYIEDKNFVAGHIAQAYSLMVPSTRLALARDLEILAKDPGFSDCGRATCLTCGLRTYQWWRIPRTLLLAGLQRLSRRKQLTEAH